MHVSYTMCMATIFQNACTAYSKTQVDVWGSIHAFNVRIIAYV